MSRTFGWSLPPGVTRVPGEGPDPGCAVCAMPVENCACQECPTCGETGNQRCYAGPENHGLKLNREQVIGRQRARLALAEERVRDEKVVLDMLEGNGEFSVDVTDSPDPWR